MNNMRKLELVKNYYEVTKIPIQVFEEQECILQIQKHTFIESSALSGLKYLQKNNVPSGYTIISGVMLIGIIQIEKTNQYIVFGPALLYPVYSKQYASLIESLQQPLSIMEDFQQWLSSIPIYDSIHFQKMLHFLDSLVNNISDMRVCYFESASNTSKLKKSAAHEMTSFFKERAVNTQEYIFENMLLSLVESGNVLELQKSINQLYHTNTKLDTQGINADRYLKNIFIGSNSIICRAAIRGGLSAPVSLGLSDYFISEIERCSTYDEILMFLSQMLITYTKAVRDSQMPKHDSLLVNKVVQNIRDHIYEPLSPTAIALNLHMDLSYLCRHFKENTGKTITACIHETKIKESKRLIRTTNLTLAQISMQMGYSSQNYFHTVFKKFTGVTPKAYAENVTP